MQASACPGDCEVSDWNGRWFADDNGSGTGTVVFRDSSSTGPALVTVNYDQASNSNLTSIILIQPSSGGGGALDIASLAGLVMLTCLLRRSQRAVMITRTPDVSPRRSIRRFVIVAIGCALAIAALPGHAADEFAFDWQHGYVGLRAGESLYQPTASSIVNTIGGGTGEIQSLNINSHQFGGMAFSLRVAGAVYLGAGIDCFHEDHACNALLLTGQLEYRFGR
jgi:hypothetical protein